MLKRIITGFAGVAIIVLLVATATFNVSSANAGSIDKNTSELKMITKYIPSYGNVTAREDMFIGEGDNIKIIMNKDYKEKGIITPIIEKYPEATYIEVNTLYGNVNVSENTYKMLGKEKIASNFEKFIETRNELIKTGMINPTISTVDILDNCSVVQNNSQIEEAVPISPRTLEEAREDLGFSRRSGMYPRFI